MRDSEESEVLRENRAVSPCDPQNYILFKMPFDYLDLVPKLLNVWKISFTMTLLFFFPPHSHTPKILDRLANYFNGTTLLTLDLDVSIGG